MTIFDIIAGGLLVVSAAVGFSRGAVKEIIAVFAFTVAVAIALILLPITGPVFRQWIHTPWMAAAAAVILLFAVVYLGLGALGKVVTEGLHESVLGGLNRMVGLGFGAVRALVVLGVFYLVFNAVTPPRLTPRWASESVLYPVARASGHVVQAMAPKALSIKGSLAPLFSRAVKGDEAQPDPDTERAVPAADDAPPTTPRPHLRGRGYDKHDRARLDALVEHAR